MWQAGQINENHTKKTGIAYLAKDEDQHKNRGCFQVVMKKKMVWNDLTNCDKGIESAERTPGYTRQVHNSSYSILEVLFSENIKNQLWMPAIAMRVRFSSEINKLYTSSIVPRSSATGSLPAPALLGGFWLGRPHILPGLELRAKLGETEAQPTLGRIWKCRELTLSIMEIDIPCRGISITTKPLKDNRRQ